MGRIFSILAVVSVCACPAAPAQAEFGFSDFDVSFSDETGAPATQAGSHPFAVTTSFEANVVGEDTDGRLKELLLDLPPGLVFDPGATPRCAAVDFATGECPLSTAVGIATIESGEPHELEDTRIYSLLTGEGPLRLGFQIAGVHGVVIDLAPDPDFHNPVAVATGWPGSLDVFSAELELWGVPADERHDGARGGPVSMPPLPLLTLPTRCAGSLFADYEALSWATELAEGEKSLTGLSGCRLPPFAPTIFARPTTSDAGSSTGLEFSMGFDNVGLANPAWLAESQVRNVVLRLPAMRIDPAVAAGIGLCSPEQLAEEGPEAITGTGCPDASRVGAFEVESPLIEGDVLEGDLYLSDYWIWSGETSADVYAVARSADRGVVIRQTLEFEPDFVDDDLNLYAELLPQLPFGRIDLQLFDGGASPLIGPPRCGKYKIEALLTPWSQDVDVRLVTEFSLDSGPSGGPCPSGEAAGPAGDGDPNPTAATSPPVVVPPAITRHKARRCPKGKRAVRRKGRRVCVRRCRRGKRLVRRKSKLRCVRVKRHKHRRHHRKR